MKWRPWLRRQTAFGKWTMSGGRNVVAQGRSFRSDLPTAIAAGPLVSDRLSVDRLRQRKRRRHVVLMGPRLRGGDKQEGGRCERPPNAEAGISRGDRRGRRGRKMDRSRVRCSFLRVLRALCERALFSSVIPAEAGIHPEFLMGPRLRGGDTGRGSLAEITEHAEAGSKIG